MTHVRRADVADAETIGQLLHDFNREFNEPTPGPRALAERVRQLLASGDTTVLLGGARRLQQPRAPARRPGQLLL